MLKILTKNLINILKVICFLNAVAKIFCLAPSRFIWCFMVFVRDETVVMKHLQRK